MKKTLKKFILIVAVILVIILGVLFYKFKISEKEFMVKQYFDINSEILLSTIKEDNINAMTLSLILSQNEDIKKCLLSQDRHFCYTTLNNYIDILSKIPLYQNIMIHTHTSELKSLVRSWNYDKFGDDLTKFRHTLLEVKNSKKSVYGIEAGRCGVFIRGISPISYDSKFLGSLEVMLDFNHLDTIAKRRGYDIFVLVDQKYFSECFQRNSLVKNYAILNESSANLNILTTLKKFDFENEEFAKINSNYFYKIELYDIKNNKIGFIILHFNNDKVENSISKLMRY